MIPIESRQFDAPAGSYHQLGPSSSSQRPFDLREFWRVLRRRTVLVLGLTLIALGVISYLLLTRPDYYDAKARVEINPESSRQATGPNQDKTAAADPAYLNTELQMITSPRLLMGVAKALDLEHDPIFQRHKETSSGLLRRLVMLRYFGETHNDELIEPSAPNRDPKLGLTIQEIAEAKRLAPYVSELKSRITIQPVQESRSLFRETRLVDIVVRHQSPVMAARLANAVAEGLIASNDEQTSRADRMRVENLMKRAVEIQADIRRAEGLRESYAKEHDILSLEPGQNTEVDRLVTINRQLLEAQNELRLAQTGYDAALQPSGATALAEETFRVSAADTQDKLADLRARRAQMLVTATEKWPEVIEVTRQIDVLEKHLGELRSQSEAAVVAKAKTQLDQARSREQTQESVFNQARAVVQTQNDAAINYRLIEQQIDTNRRILNGLLETVGANEAAKAVSVNNLRIADFAVTPDPKRPAGPMRLEFIVLVGALALGCGIAAAMLLGHLDDRVWCDDDVRLILQSRPLGGITPAHASILFFPRNPNRRPELLLGGERLSRIAEDYRRLRTLVFHGVSRPPASLMITSSAPGEGKTTIATNIAISLGQTGSKVILIDADLRCPRLHKVFGFDNSTGLSPCLEGSPNAPTVESQIRTHAASGLDVLTSGPEPTDPAERLGSERMRQILQELAKKYDRVLIDTPAVESCVDPLLLAARVDGIVVVAQSGKSKSEVVRRACASLQDAGGMLVGVVLSRANDRTKNRYVYAPKRSAAAAAGNG